MDAPAQTSLQRFVQGRGKEYADLNPPNIGQSMRYLGLWVALMPAAVILVAFLPYGNDFTVRMIAVPMVIAAFGAVFFQISMRQVRQKMHQILGERTTPLTLANGVVVTPEAQQMVMMVHWRCWRIDPRAQEAQERMKELLTKHRSKTALAYMRLTEAMSLQGEQALAAMPPSARDLLEQAAFQYNRAVGLVETADIGESGPGVVKGADAAMVVVLHRARQIVKFPVSLNVLEPRLRTSVDTLRELADSVEALTSHGGFTPTAGIDDLLDELRLKLAALNELSPVSGENLHDRA